VQSTLAVTRHASRAVRRIWVGAGLEALLAFVLAMHRINARSIWYDEGVSTTVSRLPLRELPRIAGTFDPNMTGYHAVLHLWREIFGSSETALRSLSAVSIALAVPVLVALGRRLYDDRTALTAGLILAVAPFVVRYGQEARSYGLELLVMTVVALCFVRVVDPHDPVPTRTKHVVALGAAAAFACYVHLFSVFVIVALVSSLGLLDRARVPWARLRASAAVGALLMLPMLAWLTSGPSEHLQWIPRPSAVDVLAVAHDITGGGVVTVVLGALVGLAVIRIARSFARDRRTRAQWADGLALLWLVTPLVAAFLISVTVKPILLDRYLIVCVPAVALVAATTLARLRARPLAIGALIVVVLGSLAAVELSYGQQRTDWRAGVGYFAAQSTPTDGVVVCPAKARLPVAYYLTRALPAALRPIPLSPSVSWDAALHVKRVGKVTAAEWLSRGPDRIWVIGTSQRCEFTFPGRERAVDVEFTGMTVARYDRK
jgi:uncharacterized membrane protein